MIKVEKRNIDDLRDYENNSNVHSPEQVEQIAASILEFNYIDPLTVDENNTIITGHGTRKALKLLVQRGLEDYRVVDCVVLSHLSERQKRAYVIAHNKIAKNSTWDFDKLSSELSALVECDFEVGLLAFDEQEIDSLLKADASILPKEPIIQEENEQPEVVEPKTRKAKSKLVHKCPNCGTEFSA